MSLPTDRRTSARGPTTGRGWLQGRRDAGFSLVEVVVAIGILGLLIVATLPSVIGGIRATDAARKVGQGKSVVQAELERMRNLPFWVARNAGEFVDLLDRYYPDQVAPTAAPGCGATDAYGAIATAATGYVTTQARCPWEPQSGPMYRLVRPGTAADGTEDFVVVVNTQFLSDSTPPLVVTPPADWTTKTSVRDRPPARQVRATVTVLPAAGTVKRPTQSTTQISRSQIAVPRIRAAVDVVAVEVGTSVPADVEVPLDASAGILQIRGATDYASTVDATLSAVAAAVGSGAGLTGGGATTTVNAPPSTTKGGVDSASNGQLDPSSCALVCWGGTRVSSVPASADGGLPTVGSPTSPVSADVKVPSDAGQAFRLGQGAGAGATYLPQLGLGDVLLRMGDAPVGSSTTADCQVGSSGTNVRVGASGWLSSTSRDAGLSVDACGTARTAPVSLLPTTFAPEGLLRIRLDRASTRCTVAGAGHAASVAWDYAATVQVWDGGNSFRDLATVTKGSNGLAGLQPSSVLLPGGRNLGTWISSWSGLASSSVTTTTSGGVAEVKLPGVVTVLTQPLRAKEGVTAAPSPSPSPSPAPDDGGDEPEEPVEPTEPTPTPTPTTEVEPASTLSLTVGTVSCRAEDRR